MSNYEISKSSLLSLKAEILRKQDELKNKVYKTEKRKVPLTKNKGIEQRKEKDSLEDIQELEKSRKALERKAKLYNKLSKTKIFDDDPASFENRFLVNFKDKNKDENSDSEDEKHSKENSEEENLTERYDEPENSDEEWVEYVDCLGRTRTCLKKDLKYFKSRDNEYKREESPSIEDKQEDNKTEDTSNNVITEEQQLLSDDMRREMLRQQWEKEEIELRDKDNIHYQDVLFNEARSHGVGYYSFSKDEDERRRQQASLEKLRAETKQQQQKSQELKAMREKQLAARVKAAKMRKHARLGLPIEEDEEEEAEIGPLPPHSIEDTKTKEEDSLRERLLEEARRNHVRPWDMGKETTKEFYEYTQSEWVEKKRKERINEFAPPTTSRRDFRAAPQAFEPTEVLSSLKFTTKKDTTISRGVKHLNPYKNDDLQDPYNEETKTFSQYKLPENAFKRKKYGVDGSGNSAIQRQSEMLHEDAEPKHFEETIVEERKPHTVNIQASIEAGLKYLWQQTEKSKNIRDVGNDDMFTS